MESVYPKIHTVFQSVISLLHIPGSGDILAEFYIIRVKQYYPTRAVFNV